MGWYFVRWKRKGHITVSRADPTAMLVATQDPDIVLPYCTSMLQEFIRYDHKRHSWRWYRKPDWTKDLVSVAIIYLCLFIDAADSSMLGVFYNYWTLYVTLLNDSLSDCLTGICPQIQILVAHYLLLLGSWLSLKNCKLWQLQLFDRLISALHINPYY